MGLLGAAAKVLASGAVKQLGGRAEPDQQISEADAQDPKKLSRLLTGILKDLAALKRRHAPRSIDFEDVAFTASGTKPLRHAFDGRVRWWVVDWKPASAGVVCALERHASSTSSTLVLYAGNTGTATIRVEEAG